MNGIGEIPCNRRPPLRLTLDPLLVPGAGDELEPGWVHHTGTDLTVGNQCRSQSLNGGRLDCMMMRGLISLRLDGQRVILRGPLCSFNIIPVFLDAAPREPAERAPRRDSTPSGVNLSRWDAQTRSIYLGDIAYPSVDPLTFFALSTHDMFAPVDSKLPPKVLVVSGISADHQLQKVERIRM